MISNEYAAGLFDGEGFIRVATWNKPNSVHIRYQVIVGIANTHKPVLDLIRSKYKGNLYCNRHDLKDPKNRPVHNWTAASKIAHNFLIETLPFLHIKREQAELALLLQANIDEYRHKLGTPYGGLHPQRDNILSYRRELADKILLLKKVSYFPDIESCPSD